MNKPGTVCGTVSCFFSFFFFFFSFSHPLLSWVTSTHQSQGNNGKMAAHRCSTKRPSMMRSSSQYPCPKALPPTHYYPPPPPSPINGWNFIAPKVWQFHRRLNYSALGQEVITPVGPLGGYKRGKEERIQEKRGFSTNHPINSPRLGSWSKEDKGHVEHIVGNCPRIPEQMPPYSLNKEEKHLNSYFLWTLHGLEEMIQT